MLEKILLSFLNVHLFVMQLKDWQLGCQDPASPSMEGMINFHNYIMIFLITIGTFVLWMLYKVIVDFNEETHPVSKNFTHSSTLEICWTILPAVILMFIAVPSFGFTLFIR